MFDVEQRSPIPMDGDRRYPLPDGWRWVRLGDVCTLVGDSIDPQRFPDETFAHYSIPAFDAAKSPVFELGAAILSTKTVFDEGAVLFSKLNPRIPRTWFVDDRHTRRRICSTEFLPLKPEGSYLLPEYLAGVLQSPQVIIKLRAAVAAATKSRERVRPESVMSLNIPLPPLNEQRRIAAILAERMATVERARAAAEEQLAAAKALPAAELRALFESAEAQAWPRVRLGDVLRLRKDIVHPYDNPAGPATFVGLEHIVPGTGQRTGAEAIEMSELTGRKPRFFNGDIVYGYLRPYLNKVWIAEFDGLCSVDQYVYSVDPAKADAKFIGWFMRSSVYLERAPINASPGQLPRIRTEEVAAVEINLPSLTEQRHGVARLNARMADIAQLRASLEAQLDVINALPAALMRQAFNGELPVARQQHSHHNHDQQQTRRKIKSSQQARRGSAWALAYWLRLRSAQRQCKRGMNTIPSDFRHYHQRRSRS